MNQEEALFQKHLVDLARIADQRSIVTFTDFLNLNELNIFHTYEQRFSFVKWKTFGGYEHAERQMAAFIPDALLFTWDYPIACLRIRPLNRKFAEDLNHRDYLGAVLNLGIDRSKTGDILTGEKEAWMFCTESMADFLCRELTRVRHTSVLCERCDSSGIQASLKTEVITGTVSSVRLDSVLAVACRASRSSLISSIEEGRVFVNGRLVTSNGHQLREGDLISLRGTGRFRFLEVGSQSRKGRYFIKIEKYQ
ncbi:MAG: YlmH/Sll1252 family protein [Candidatus Limivivens sp.]|nr:YlmH/Sll1252 family protein [Candidatus Limivivens sp.]